MKKCPKCGAMNKPESSACYNCFASLEGVPVSDAPVSPQVPPAVPPPVPPVQGQQIPGGNAGYAARPGGPLGGQEESSEPVSVVGQPLGGYQGQQTPPPGGYAPHPGSHGTAGRGVYRHPEPIRKSSAGTTIAIVILLIAILGGGGFACWKFIYLPSTPVGVVKEAIKAAKKGGDADRKYFTKDTSPDFDMDMSDNKEIGLDRPLEEVKDYTVVLKSADKEKATVNLKMGSAVAKTMGDKMSVMVPGIQMSLRQEIARVAEDMIEEGLPIILEKEDGKWRISGGKTESAMMEFYISIGTKAAVNMKGSLPGMPVR